MAKKKKTAKKKTTKKKAAKKIDGLFNFAKQSNVIYC